MVSELEDFKREGESGGDVNTIDSNQGSRLLLCPANGASILTCFCSGHMIIG